MLAEVTKALQLGDDLLILGHRLSEWCGHGPFLEEDIALANISLDCLGQAQTLLGIAAELEKKNRNADKLAFFRGAHEFRNCTLVEQANGDFAQTIVRQFLYTSFILAELEQIDPAQLPRLAEYSEKAQKELSYHLRHSTEWLYRLGDGTAESNRRVNAAVDYLWKFTGDMFVDSLSDHSQWLKTVQGHLKTAKIALPQSSGQCGLDGRRGAHSEELGPLLAEMQVTARAFPDARW